MIYSPNSDQNFEEGPEEIGGNLPAHDQLDFSYNNWKYLIVHAWETERTTWEDVYLMPDDPTYKGDSTWLTVEAVDRPLARIKEAWNLRADSDVELQQIVQAEFEETHAYLEKAKPHGFFIDDNANMYIARPDFSKAELIEWVVQYLVSKGVELPILREGKLHDFEGSNQHVQEMGKAKEILDHYLKSSEKEGTDRTRGMDEL